MSDTPSPPAQAAAITEAYLRIKARIDKACRLAGRDPAEVRLSCVTKTLDWARIEPVLELGHRRFGENRVQEALLRWAGVRASGAYPGLELSLIGPLQTNKVRAAVQLFDKIETIDRPRLAEALAAEIALWGRTPQLYIQVNIGEEPQKAGVLPHDLPQLVTQCRDLGLNITGLMAIPPVDGPRGPYFALLARLAGRAGLSELSMGMSDDFETAIGFGATDIRVGSAIFGAR